MDAIALVMALFLTASEPCTELPARETVVGGETYRIQALRCGEATVKVWSYQCQARPGSTPYWSRPFLLEEERTGEGLYLNRFAELQAGWHVALDDVYRPACGA